MIRSLSLAALTHSNSLMRAILCLRNRYALLVLPSFPSHSSLIEIIP